MEESLKTMIKDIPDDREDEFMIIVSFIYSSNFS